MNTLIIDAQSVPTLYRSIRLVSVMVFPFLLIAFVGLYRVDPSLYVFQLREDRLIEWLTFGLLCVSGSLSLFIVIQTWVRSSKVSMFFLTFGFICFLGALEEISWGQRIFNFESSDFFLRHSDQKETNAHNILQQWLHIKTKHVAGIVLFFYGVGLPCLACHSSNRALFNKVNLVIPPLFLSLGFLLGALMMFDRPTRQEEEIGELFFSLCFVLFMLYEYLMRRDSPSRRSHFSCSSDIKFVALGVGVMLAGILSVCFNDNSVAGERGLLTYVSVVLLLLISAAAFSHIFRANEREKWFWGLISVGFFYLTFDEYFQFHERLDKWIHLTLDIQETAITDQLDGMIVLLYCIMALGMFAVYWNTIKQYRMAFKFLAAAFVFLLLMIVLDLLHTDFYFDNRYFEETCKIVSEYFFLLAFVTAHDTQRSSIAE